MSAGALEDCLVAWSVIRKTRHTDRDGRGLILSSFFFSFYFLGRGSFGHVCVCMGKGRGNRSYWEKKTKWTAKKGMHCLAPFFCFGGGILYIRPFYRASRRERPNLLQLVAGCPSSSPRTSMQCDLVNEPRTVMSAISLLSPEYRWLLADPLIGGFPAPSWVGGIRSTRL